MMRRLRDAVILTAPVAAAGIGAVWLLVGGGALIIALAGDAAGAAELMGQLPLGIAYVVHAWLGLSVAACVVPGVELGRLRVHSLDVEVSES